MLLPTLGSSGDVHPFIALGTALRARGHRATILTNPYFRELIEAQGLEFLPVGRIEDVGSAIADPDLWHARRGFEVVARRVILPAIGEIYRLIESRSDSHTVIAASSISLGARIAQEKLGIPTASVHLQPTVIRSYVEQGIFGNVRISKSAADVASSAHSSAWSTGPPSTRRDQAAGSTSFAQRSGLLLIDRVFDRWLHSPQCVIAFFPAWFAPPQSDWPPNTHQVGFPLWDAAGTVNAESGLREYLQDGAPPVLFTPGSAASTMQGYFRESVEAVRRLGVQRDAGDEFPGAAAVSDLPSGMKAFELPALQRRAAARRAHRCITGESVRSRKPSRPASRTSSCQAPTTSSTMAGASSSSVSGAAFLKRAIAPCVQRARSMRFCATSVCRSDAANGPRGSIRPHRSRAPVTSSRRCPKLPDRFPGVDGHPTDGPRVASGNVRCRMGRCSA